MDFLGQIKRVTQYDTVIEPVISFWILSWNFELKRALEALGGLLQMAVLLTETQCPINHNSQTFSNLSLRMKNLTLENYI